MGSHVTLWMLYFALSVIQLICADCTVSGYYCDISQRIPQICPTGHYCIANTDTPTPCPAGTFNTRLGGTAITDCSVCTIGNFCPPATSIPRPCPPGTFGETSGLNYVSNCTTCPSGSYCTGGNSTVSGICPRGYYCPSGTQFSTQFPCLAGTFNPNSGGTQISDCSICSSGTHCSSDGSFAEVTCPTGHYCVSGIAVPCRAGTYNSGIAQTACEDCPSGSYCLTGADTPIPCPAGYRCPTGTMTATQYPCPEGSYTASVGHSDCSSCPEKFYCPVTGTSTPLECPLYHYCPVSSANPILCAPGTVSNGSVSECSTCPNGFECFGGKLIGPCPTGHFCNGSSYPVPCPPGTYNNATGSSSILECRSCTLGTFSFNSGQPTCTQCTGGYYCGIIGTSTPILCPYNHYCAPGSSTPFLCNPDSSIGRAANISFIDIDSRPGFITGLITWIDSPGIFDDYVVYASSNGTQRTFLLGTAPFGTNFLRIPRGTFIALQQKFYEFPTHVLVVPRDDNGEQCNSANYISIVDLVRPTNTTFFDNDIRHGMIGGVVEWAAGDAVDLSGYRIYLSSDGFQRTFYVGAVNASVTRFTIANGTIFDGLSHVVVTMIGANGVEYTNQDVFQISDRGVPVNTVHSLRFTDVDETGGEISGNLDWALPLDTSDIQEFVIYASSDGVTRTLPLAVVPSYATRYRIPENTASPNGLHSWNTTFLFVVSKNEVGEGFENPMISVVDVAVPVTTVGTLDFADIDPDENEISGWVKWDPLVGSSDVTHFRVYGSIDGSERTRELTNGLWDQTTWVVHGTASAFFVPTDTPKQTLTHIIVVTCNQIGCNLQNPNVAIIDKRLKPVKNLLAYSLSATSIQLRWNNPNYATQYEVWRQNNDDEIPLFTSLSGVIESLNYTDTTVSIVDGLTNTYTYQVFAGDSGIFETTGAMVSAQPAARVIREPVPDLRVVRFSKNALTVRWLPDFRATRYHLEYRKAQNESEPFVLAATIAVSRTVFGNFDLFPGHSTTDCYETELTGLQSATAYVIRVVSENPHGNQTVNFATVTATTASTVPTAFDVVVGSPLPLTVPLMWTDNKDVSHYQLSVKQSEQDDSWFRIIENDLRTPFYIGTPPLIPSTNYTMRVSAINNFGTTWRAVNVTTSARTVSVVVSGSQIELQAGSSLELAMST